MPKTSKEQQDYQKLAKKHQPRPDFLRNSINAFWVGGTICLLGQGFNNWFLAQGLPKGDAGAYTAVVMIFLGSLLTGFGVYDEISRVGGAGAAIPITGFANTIVSAAMDFKSEGYVLGMAAQMYKIAGPVITFGVVSAVAAGLIKWIIGG